MIKGESTQGLGVWRQRAWIRVVFVIVGSISAEPIAAEDSPGVATRQVVSTPSHACELGGDKHLFLDEFLLSSVRGAHLQVNPPEIKELVLFADQLWERGGITSYGNVFFDPYIGRYRMYYVPVNVDAEPMFNTCLALSDDGVHWEKPVLGIVEWQGSAANNIVIRRQREGTVFIDPHAPPKRRYACISSDEKNLSLFTSPDGVHFTMRAKLSDFRSDSQISSFWDERIAKFVHYPRLEVNRSSNPAFRGVGRLEAATVDDKEPWQAGPEGNALEPRGAKPVMTPDGLDPPGVDLYTNAAQKYCDVPNAYVAFPTPYYQYNYKGREYLNQPTLDAGGKTNDGVIESQLAVSRDGMHWKRYRVPYIPLCRVEGLDLKVCMIYPGIILRDGAINQYFSGYAFTHGDTQARRRLQGRELGGVYRVEQRLDGFVSLDFDYDGGEVITEPLTFHGSELVLNVDTSASGEARVAILDEYGEEIAPFAIDDCRIVNGNYIRKLVHWKETSDVSQLAGKPVRLKLSMRGAKLYSFQFQ